MQAEIEGYASGADSLVKAGHASVMELLVHDRRTLQPLVLKAGGTLECKPGSTTATVLSGGQCSNHWLNTDGVEGAQMDTRNHRTCHLMLPEGHEVQIYQRNGQFGFDAWPVDPASDVYHSAKHIWVAKDEVYRPPDEGDVAPDVSKPYSVKMQAMCPRDMVIGQVFSSVSNTGTIRDDFLVTNRGPDPKTAVVFEPVNWTESSVRRIAPVDVVASWVTELVPHSKILETPIWEPDVPKPKSSSSSLSSASDPEVKIWSAPQSKQVKFLTEVIHDEEMGHSNSALHRHAEHIMAAPALGQYTYLEPLSADPSDQYVGLARFAMHSARKIQRTLELSHGGGEVYTPDGRAVLTSSATRYIAPAAKMHRHKRKKNSKLDRDRTKFEPDPCDLLTGDMYYSLLGPSLGDYIMLFVDGAVPYGDCHVMKSKLDLLGALELHVSNMPKKPKVFLGDQDPTQQKGRARDFLQGISCQVRGTTPHRQSQNYRAEGYARQWSTAVTFMMLDSQLPKKFTIYAGKAASVVLSVMAIEFKGRETTAFFEYHGVKFDIRLLKRIGCEVFFLLEKKDRAKFGVKGRRGVLLGFPMHSGPEWSYWVYDFLSGHVLLRRDVLFNEKSMPFVDARMKFTSVTGKPHFSTRGVGHFHRSMLRETDGDYNLDGWDHADYSATVCNDTLNEYLHQHDPVLTPLRKGDTLFVGSTPTTVTNVAWGEVTTRDLLSDALLVVPTDASLYRDSEGLLVGHRYSLRNRTAAVFFTPDDSKARIAKQAAAHLRKGEDLVGRTFVDSITPSRPPVEFTVTGTCRFENKPALAYKPTLTPETGPKAFVSTVPEVRSWVDTLAPSPFGNAPQPEPATSVPPESPPDSTNSTPPDELGDATASVEILKTAIQNAQSTIPSLEGKSADEILRTRIATCTLARKPKKIPRKVVLAVLQHKPGSRMPERFFKYGTQFPKNRKDAIDPTRTKNYKNWIHSMDGEVNGLTELGAFLKGLTLADLPEGVTREDVIRSL